MYYYNGSSSNALRMRKCYRCRCRAGPERRNVLHDGLLHLLLWWLFLLVVVLVMMTHSDWNVMIHQPVHSHHHWNVVHGFTPCYWRYHSKDYRIPNVKPTNRKRRTILTERNNDRTINNNNNNNNSNKEKQNPNSIIPDTEENNRVNDDTTSNTVKTSPLLRPPSDSNDDDDDDDDEDKDFSNWIVSNLKHWPLLNMESSSSSSEVQSLQNPLTTTVATLETSSNIGIPSINNSNNNSNSNNNVWNDIGSLLLQSTIPLPFGNRTSSSLPLSKTSTTTTTSAITSYYLRSPLSQVFNIESILPLLMNPTTTSKDKITITQNAENNTSSGETTATVSNVVTVTPTSPTITTPNDSLLKQATARIEAIVTEASTVVSSDTVMALINKASELVRSSSSSSSSSSSTSTSISTPDKSVFPSVIDSKASNNKIEASTTPSLVRDSVTTYATSILRIADGLLRKGYVNGDIIAQKILKGGESILKDVPIVTDSQALFNEYRSVKEINMVSPELIKATEMGALAGAIYEETIPRTHALRQTIVARGTSADVTWMISDSIANHTSFTTGIGINSEFGNQPFLVRTITIRGFDASDESVDREQLLNQICTATPVQLWNNTIQPPPLQLQDVLVHSGLLRIARTIYADVKQYVDWTASSHKLVLNGHSIGGSIAILLLMLMIQDYGVEYVRKKIVQVYTFGSPPVTGMRNPTRNVLTALDVPTTLIQGFIQPWDPIVRLFTVIDALYPLVSDLGPDNTTPFANGPPRALRPLLKSILVSWAGWPRFRDNYKGTAKQSYTSVGVQHIILPEPTRYLADRFLAVNIPVPPVETIVQISSDEVYLALSSIFPLDVFEVSYIPQAIRSFVHHFYPAYGFPLVEYVKELQRRSRGLPERKREFAFSEDDAPFASNSTPSTNDGGIDWGKATQWFTGSDSKL